MDVKEINIEWCKKHGLIKQGMNVASCTSYNLTKDGWNVMHYNEDMRGTRSITVFNHQTKESSSIEYPYDYKYRKIVTENDLKLLFQLANVEYIF